MREITTALIQRRCPERSEGNRLEGSGKNTAPTPLILRSHAELVEAWRLEGSKDEGSNYCFIR